MKRIRFFLGLILVVAFALTAYGIQVGVPFRWFVDETYAISVRILTTRSLTPVLSDMWHPSAYPIVLAIFLIPYFAWLKITHYPLELAGKSASISWTSLAFDYPDLASGIILWSRLLSVLLGVASCYIVYRLGKKLDNVRSGLLAALVLATTMDFCGTNHFATRTPLVNFLVLLSFYYVVRFYDSDFKRRFIKVAALVAGLSISTKVTGLISLAPLCVVWLFNKKKSRLLSKIVVFLLLGILVGNPKLLTEVSLYLQGYSVMLGSFSRAGEGDPIGLYERSAALVNYFLQIVYGMGIPFSLSALIGCFFYYSEQRSIFKKLIIAAMLLSYWIAISMTEYGFKDAPSKGSVLLLPYLALLAGIGLERLLSNRNGRWVRWSLVIIVFVYSFWHCLSSDWVFVKGDTRYQVTKWIKENVPKRSKIEFFSLINRGASEELYKDYQILFGGFNSAELKGISPFKEYTGIKETMGEYDPYYASILNSGPKGEYVLLSFDFFGEIEMLEKGDTPISTVRVAVVQRLLQGEYPYRRIKEFIPKNNKIASKRFRGVAMPISFWKNPISNIGYVSPIIYLYKKVNEPNRG